MLEIIGLCAAYGKRQVLFDINTSLGRGKFTAIIGRNGSGKSTLLSCLASSIRYSGKILLDGEDITNLSITERARKGISFAFQQPVRFKGITVHDLISLASGKDISVTDACSYLSQVGLCARDYINREVNASLSGGELKRIEIATVLARSTKVSLFDEPEAGIDLWSFNNLIKVFEKMHDTLGGSVIIISHQERILNIADKVIVIANGSIKQEGEKEEILPEPLGKANVACKVLTDNC